MPMGVRSKAFGKPAGPAVTAWGPHLLRPPVVAGCTVKDAAPASGQVLAIDDRGMASQFANGGPFTRNRRWPPPLRKLGIHCRAGGACAQCRSPVGVGRGCQSGT
jgi:hypothetical protein